MLTYYRRQIFKILIRLIFRMAQGVEYDSLSIMRIDDKYNSLPPATQMKQYKSQYLKHEKW